MAEARLSSSPHGMMRYLRYSLSLIVISFIVTNCSQSFEGDTDFEEFSLPASVEGQVEEEACPRAESEYRLPRNVLPINYKLTLWPQLSNYRQHDYGYDL